MGRVSVMEEGGFFSRKGTMRVCFHTEGYMPAVRGLLDK